MPEMEDRVAAAIYRVYERDEKPRAYLGGSVIGEPCERALWYGFRGQAAKFDGRMLRLFDSGHREEARIIEDLRRAGMTVMDRDASGQQYGFELLGGHVGSHVDGVVQGVPDAPKTPHLLEVKTHNDKSFADLKAKGVQKSKPVHYAQMQFYMGALGLERALYVAVEKSSDTIYTERVKFDPDSHRDLLAKAERIVRADAPPARITEDPAWYECKLCDHRKVCWGEAMPTRDCRTCAMVAVQPSGGWHCSRWGAQVPTEALTGACDDHVYMPDLVPGVEAQDAGPDSAPYVLYLHKASGVQWINGNPATIKDSTETTCSILTSAQLEKVNPELFGDPGFASLMGAVGEGASVLSDDDVPF